MGQFQKQSALEAVSPSGGDTCVGLSGLPFRRFLEKQRTNILETGRNKPLVCSGLFPSTTVESRLMAWRGALAGLSPARRSLRRLCCRPSLSAAPALFPRQARQPLPQLIQIVLLSLFRTAYQQAQSTYFIAQPFQLGPIVAPPVLFGVAPLFDQNIESSGNTFQGVALPFQQTPGPPSRRRRPACGSWADFPAIHTR